MHSISFGFIWNKLRNPLAWLSDSYASYAICTNEVRWRDQSSSSMWVRAWVHGPRMLPCNIPEQDSLWRCGERNVAKFCVACWICCLLFSSWGRGAYEREMVKSYTGYRCRPWCVALAAALLLLPLWALTALDRLGRVWTNLYILSCCGRKPERTREGKKERERESQRERELRDQSVGSIERTEVEAGCCGISGPSLPVVNLMCWIVKLATTTGSTCGRRSTRQTAVLVRAEVAVKKRRSSTGWFMCQWCSLPTITMCLSQCLRHRILSTRTTMSTCLQRSSTSILSITSDMTARKAIPIGTSDGLRTRSLGAAAARTWDALAPGMEATTSTLMFLPQEWDMRVAESMTATLASPIGCKAGRIPRRTGAAPNRTGAAQSSTAIPVRSLDSIGFPRVILQDSCML